MPVVAFARNAAHANVLTELVKNTIQYDQEKSVPDPLKVQEPKQQVVEQVVLRRSTRDRKAVSSYIPSMSGSKYGYAMTQLSEEGIIFPESHAFNQNDFYDHDPVIVATVRHRYC